MFGNPIHEATERDYPTFLKLWVALMESQAELGSDILVTPKNVAFFTALFNIYLGGMRRGVVLLAGDCGVSMWGEDVADSPLDTKYAPFARGWGTYITPEHRRQGLASQMREYGSRRMHEMGFKYVGGVLLLSNEISQQSLKKYETSTPLMFHIKALEDL